jgi:hypothetical protein
MKRHRSPRASTGHGTGVLQELWLRRRLEGLKRHRKFGGVSGVRSAIERKREDREKGPAQPKPGNGHYARLHKAFRAWQRKHAIFMASIALPLCMR